MTESKGWRRARSLLAAAWLGAAALLPAAAQAPAGLPASANRFEVSHGQFEHITVLRPAGAPQQFVLQMTGNETPSAADWQLAQSMAAKGAMVAVVPLPPFLREISAVSPRCVYSAGAIENFARYVQAQEKLSTYILPLLVGTGPDGGTFVYTVLAQAPANNFTGVLSLGFCPRQTLAVPMCTYNSLHAQAADGKSVTLQAPGPLGAPWTVLQTPEAAACAGPAQAFVRQVPRANWLAPAGTPAATPAPPPGFDAAFAALAAQRAPIEAPPTALGDLPIVELPAAGDGQRLAIILSGDGGWADIDKRLGAALVKDGVAVAGLDSLRYFWSARTPEGLAADLDRVIRFYTARWKRSEVILVGYSQGADVLPFAFNRLPARTQALVHYSALLGPGIKASFEFHVTNWIGPSGDRPIEPEMRRMTAANTLCVYGTDEAKNSVCPLVSAANAKSLGLPGGHHLGGDYEALVKTILDAIPR